MKGRSAAKPSAEHTTKTMTCTSKSDTKKLTTKVMAAPRQNHRHTSAGAAASARPSATVMPSQMMGDMNALLSISPWYLYIDATSITPHRTVLSSMGKIGEVGAVFRVTAVRACQALYRGPMLSLLVKMQSSRGRSAASGSLHLARRSLSTKGYIHHEARRPAYEHRYRRRAHR